MDAWNRLTNVKGKGGRSEWIKDGEEIIQSTYTYA